MPYSYKQSSYCPNSKVKVKVFYIYYVRKVFSSQDILILYFSIFRLALGYTNQLSCDMVPGFTRKAGLLNNRPSGAEFIVPDWREKVDSGMWFLYWPAGYTGW
jgi:hypothetical protein